MPVCNGSDRGGDITPPPKGGRLPRGVGGRGPSVNRRRLGCRSVGGAVMALAGAPAATVITAVAGPAVVTPRLHPRPRGQPRLVMGRRGTAEPRPLVSRRDVVRCSSRMRRNGARPVL